MRIEPHLVLLDANLTYQDGFHVCRALRRHSQATALRFRPSLNWAWATLAYLVLHTGYYAATLRAYTRALAERQAA